MNTKPFFKKKRVWVGGLFLLLFGICAISTDPKNASGTETQPPKESKYLIKSPDEITHRFNAFADDVKFSYRLQDVEIKEGTAQNSFESHLNNILTFGADLNKDNSVKDLYAICSGNGTKASGVDAITLMVGVIAVADPSLKPAQRIGVLKSLGMLDSNVNHLDGKYSNNGVSYEVFSTPEWVKLSASL